jgi:hypothetical protein
MEISLRQRILVGVFATVVIVGSGVATALVASNDGPTVGEAVDTTSSTGDTVGSTLPSTPSSTVVTTPGGAAGDTKVDDGDAGETTDVARYWDSEECGGDEAMNHGQYVSSQPKGGESRSTAAQSDCGKPLTSVGDGGDDGDDRDDGDAPEVDVPDDDGGSAPSDAPGKSGSAPGHNK